MASRALLTILVLCTLLDVASRTSAQVLINGSLSANETLTIFREVQATNVALLDDILSGNITGADEFLAADVQFVVANTSAPLTLVNNGSAVANIFASVAPAPGSNVTFSERIFLVLDRLNIAFVDVFNTGQLNINYFLTAIWQKQGPKWFMKFTSLAPAYNGTVVTRTLPDIFVTFNNTANATSAANLVNSTLPANFTTQPAVGNATGKLQAALSNSSLSLKNVTDEFFAPEFHLVVPGLNGPIPLNLTDPTFQTFFTLIRTRNVTAPPPTAVSYMQLSREAAMITVLVPDVPMIGNAYIVLLWQYITKTANTTTNAAPVARWLLVLASVNIAPLS